MANSSDSSDADDLILEGVVVTLDEGGQPNIAPMGPRVDRAISRLVLRPFQTAQTFRNLTHSRCGVFHVTDDVDLMARAAVGSLDQPPELVSLENFPCPRLADCCRWLAFHVDCVDDASERVTMECSVVNSGDVRPFLGFNRAKHAVLEVAILATRIGILPPAEIQRELERLTIPVEKTAGHQERRAFHFLQNYIALHLTPDLRPPTPDS